MPKSGAPYIEIDLNKIHHNALNLVKLYGAKNIGIMGVTKVVLGNPVIAKSLTAAGIKYLGDSRIENIKIMRDNNVKAEFVLIRTPFINNAEQVIKYADISFNTELTVIKKLSKFAIKLNKEHKIVIMIEMGDLREGILKNNIEQFVGEIINLKGIKFIGIGTNLACFGGIKPTVAKMKELSEVAQMIERKFNIKLEFISGGNSANFEYLHKSKKEDRINNIRLGESIFLGCETLYRNPIDGLYQDAITLVAEVIESNIKESIPNGENCQNAFGETLEFIDKGEVSRAILGLGRQDVDVDGLTPLINVDIIGSSSDHIILEDKNLLLSVGDKVRFKVNYSALLSAMTSPYVKKIIINKNG